MRICFLMCAWLLLLPRIGSAEPAGEFVETFPSGAVNWSRGFLVARSTFTPTRTDIPTGVDPEQSIEQAQRQAVRNALRILQEVRLDTVRRVSQLMAADEQIGARVREMAAAARIIEVQPLADGAVRVAVQMELRGGFAQLVLPAEIKQVESIRQMTTPNPGKQAESQAPLPTIRPATPEGHSGLIVDARGIGAKPAMVPLLLDENGKQVYGPAFISREYAVQHGVCEFDRKELSAFRERVAPHPLTIKGLRTMPDDRDCDIVISNADAERLRDASANLGFLKQCRVVIVLD